MSDQTDDAADAADPKKKFRSPPYPMFDLGNAVERIKNVYAKAQGHPVNAKLLAEAWGMKSGDGKVWRAAAALIQYGLMVDSGTGEARKFQLTQAAQRIVLDADPQSEKRAAALKQAALAPMIHAELWGRFKAAKQLSDSVISNYLTLDRKDEGAAPYNPASVDEVIKTYRASIAYAGLAESDTVAVSPTNKDHGKPEDSKPASSTKIKVGEYVKWTSAGVDQFEARMVREISADGTHLWVTGSQAGIPMNEVEKVSPPASSVTAPASLATAPNAESQPSQVDENKPAKTKGALQGVTTSVIGNRLQLSAEVDAEQIDALVTMLRKYQEILKLMN